MDRGTGQLLQRWHPRNHRWKAILRKVTKGHFPEWP